MDKKTLTQNIEALMKFNRGFYSNLFHLQQQTIISLSFNTFVLSFLKIHELKIDSPISSVKICIIKYS